jgi:hypothetical protein
VPEQRVFEDLLPRPDAGQRCVDENEPRDAVGILRGKSIADHVADIMRDEVGSVDFQLVKHARHVADAEPRKRNVTCCGCSSYGFLAASHAV